MAKTNKPFRFTIYFELCTHLPKSGAERNSNMKVYYIIPRNYQLTGHPENFKLYDF